MMSTMKGTNKMTPESLLQEWYGRNMLARMRFHVDIPDEHGTNHNRTQCLWHDNYNELFSFI